MCTDGCVQVCDSACERECAWEPEPVPQKAGGGMEAFQAKKLSLNYSSSSRRGRGLHNSWTGLHGV